MDDEPAADVLENGVVARRIGQRQMERRKLVGHVRDIGRDQCEGFLCKRLDGFGYRCEVVEHILCPQRDRKPGTHPVPDGVLRLGKPQQIGDQPLLVHSVSRRDVVCRSNDTAVFRSPFERVLPGLAISPHPPGKNPQIGSDILLPVHRSSRQDNRIQSRVHDPCTGRSRHHTHCRQTQRQSQHAFDKSHDSIVFAPGSAPGFSFRQQELFLLSHPHTTVREKYGPPPITGDRARRRKKRQKSPNNRTYTTQEIKNGNCTGTDLEQRQKGLRVGLSQMHKRLTHLRFNRWLNRWFKR